MIKQTMQLIIGIHKKQELKYENTDILDLIESKKVWQQQPEFHIIRSQNDIIYDINNIKYYLKTKLENLKLPTTGFKSDFKKPCFNCSSSFHCSSYEDGHFNFQKMFEIENECLTCTWNFTTERLFDHKCNICNVSFKNCTLLVQHHRTEHNSKKAYQCAACHQSLSHKTALRCHIWKHKLPNICPFCNKRFAMKLGLKSHMLSHVGDTPFSCSYCPKKYKQKKSLDYHLFEHTGGQHFKCDLCDKTFAVQYKLNQHKIFHMGKPFHCKYCPKRYTTKPNLYIHLFEHVGGKKFKCDACDKTFARQHLLNHHKSTHIEQIFQCKYCPKQYKTKQYLRLHLFEHTGGKKFKCDVCDKTFARQHLLNHHKSAHMEKSFQCQYCEKLFKTNRDLYLHLFEHTGAKEFKCDLCNKSFATQPRLNKHKRVAHINSFHCIYCTKQYKSKQSLNLHIFEHTGGKEFKCDTCDKIFAAQHKLKQHKLTHVEKTLPCTICLKFYKTPSDLRWHNVRVHKLLK